MRKKSSASLLPTGLVLDDHMKLSAPPGTCPDIPCERSCKDGSAETDSCSRSRSKGWETSPCNSLELAPKQLVKGLSGLGLWLGFITAKKQSQKGLGFGRKKSMKKMCQPPSVKEEAAESKYVFKNHTCTVNPSINTSPRQISASAEAPSLGFYWHASQQNCSS